jgi:HAD superfamily hydrolase (TIGR01450 family)
MDLKTLRGFAFDLDGTVWSGAALLPGAAEMIAALRRGGRRVVFVSNNSRRLAGELARRLAELGIPARPDEVLSAIELIGETIRRRLGRSRVLALGSEELAGVLADAGHVVIGVESWVEADAVAIGVDTHFSYDRLRAAAEAVARGAALFAVNLDARFPVGPGRFDPGCGALAEAIATASGVRPVAIGKPSRPLFEMALERLGCAPDEAAMVGDSPEADLAGGRDAGMATIWIDPDGQPHEQANLVVRDLEELLVLWREAHA